VAYAAPPAPPRDDVDVDLADQVAASRPPAVPPAPAATKVTAGDLAHAAELILTSQFGSPSMIQRKMRIEFADAMHIFDRLAELGIVRKSANPSAAWDVLEPAGAADDTVRWIKENVQ
jgi:uncharacterized protein (DUF2342 family)